MEIVTLITAVHKYDTPNIFLQAHSLLKHWEGDKNWIIYADDIAAFKFVTDHILPLMSGWNVRVTNKKYKASDGWIRQQIVKIYESSQVQTDYSLILDSKNFLIKPASMDTFLNGGIWFMELKDCDFYKENMHVSENLLGFKNKIKIPASITPWIWKTTIVNELICKLPNFDQWETVPGTEWFLYWLIAQDKVEWISKGWVSGLWAGDQFIKQSQQTVESLPDLVELYWWAHHHTHISIDAKNITKSLLLTTETIANQDLLEKWDSMIDELSTKDENHFLLYRGKNL